MKKILHLVLILAMITIMLSCHENRELNDMFGEIVGDDVEQQAFIGDVLCSDGTIIKPSQLSSDKNLRAVVFYVDASGKHGKAVALNDVALGAKKKWGKMNTDINHLKNYYDSSDVIEDFNGYENVYYINYSCQLNYNTSYPAASSATDYVDGYGGLYWYLPALGELYKLYINKNTVNKTINLIDNAKPLYSYDTFWSSTESSKDKAWYYCFDGKYDKIEKDSEFQVRPIVVF